MDIHQEEIHLRISSFLSVPDVLAYESSCKKIRSNINLKRLDQATLTHITDLRERGDRLTGGQKRLWIRFEPILFPNLIHTVVFTCECKDQGWGNRKGRIFIAELPKGGEVHSDTNFGMIVVQSSTAEHYFSKCRLEFKVNPDCDYALFYSVGGGGGHELFARNAELSAAIHSPCATIANKLVKQMPDLFFVKLLDAIIDSDTISNEGGGHAGICLLLRSVGVHLSNERNVDHFRTILQEFHRYFSH